MIKISRFYQTRGRYFSTIYSSRRKRVAEKNW